MDVKACGGRYWCVSPSPLWGGVTYGLACVAVIMLDFTSSGSFIQSSEQSTHKDCNRLECGLTGKFAAGPPEEGTGLGHPGRSSPPPGPLLPPSWPGGAQGGLRRILFLLSR